MGKHRKPSGNGPGPAAKADADVLPSFDEKALSALTEKIEKGFGKKTKAPQQLADNGNGNHQKARPSNGRGESDSRTKAKKSEHNRGKKRDAQGNVKAAGKGKAESSSRETNTKNGGANEDRDALLKEILALGGTEEDLDLVAGAASDEDVEEDNVQAQDKSFKKDLAKFVAGLGIEGAAVDDVSEPEAEPEEEAEEDWEEASDLDSPEESDVSDEPEEAQKKPHPALPDTKKMDASSKGPNRLVSISPL
jgi:ribosome biogenesis protein MAK21